MPDTYHYNHIGRKLREYRVRFNFTQQNLADALGCNRSTYTYYETGKTIPDIYTLMKIAKVYDVNVIEFLPPERDVHLFSSPYSGSGRQRPQKFMDEGSDKIGGLTADEKSLIALLRAEENLSAGDTLRVLLKNLEKLRNGEGI